MPGWITGEGPKPYRPAIPIWVAKRADKAHAGERGVAQQGFDLTDVPRVSVRVDHTVERFGRFVEASGCPQG